MRSTQQLSITLPNEMADLVRAKVCYWRVRDRKRSHPGRIADLACTGSRCGKLVT